MQNKLFTLLIVSTLFFSCKKHGSGITPPPPPPPPPTPVQRATIGLLKDLTIPHLPSPFYHFEYDAEGKISFASFASGFTMYDFIYDNGKLQEMRNNTAGNTDRLQYNYDNLGRATAITYANLQGIVNTQVIFTYAGDKLIELERQRKNGAGFATDKKVNFSYYPDGNLRQTIDHRTPFNTPEQTFINTYDQYDNKVNGESFTYLHPEFFDHWVVLPGVWLQKNNPGRLTHTGDDVNYQINWTYTFNTRNEPTTKVGDGVWQSGANAGQHFQDHSFFTYY